MALSTVILKWNVTDLVQGGQTATLLITPTAQLSDPTDHVLVSDAVTRRIVFSGGTGQLAGIVANDSGNVLPQGAGYTIEVLGSNGQAIVQEFTTQILIANGATQWLDQLATVPVVATQYQYLPLPSGTPTAGQLPVATGAGTASKWASPAPWFTNKSGAYVQGQTSVSTSVTLGNQLLRLTPVILASSLTITALGTELVTAGADANSLIRLAMYADDGTGYPGSLLVDAGSISTGTGNAGNVATGGTPGVYMITLGTPLALTPGFYWLGGALQGAPSTPLPTMRTGSFGTQFAGGPNSVPGASAAQIGYTQSSVSGAMPSTFTTFSSAGAAGTVPRIIFKIQ